MTQIYREGYSLYISNGILFNHESPRRGETFVTRKITRGLTQILSKKSEYLYLGNLDARRDWGFAPEYVEAMWMILQQKEPEDFVIGTGETHSVNEFVNEVFSYAGLDPKAHVKIDQRYFRPTEVEVLIADASKANNKLKWKPKVKFSELAKIMMDSDMRKAGLDPIGEGDEILQKLFPDKWWNGD
jgi:GDPmannose 4,6-dehydratase